MALNVSNRVSLVEERLDDFVARLATSEERAQAFSTRLDELMASQEEARWQLRNTVGGRVLEQPRVKVPEPKPFGRARVAKELENLLWDMEQFFTAARASEDRVTVTSMYLTRDAKL
ncbi:hypothetical protein AMTR_s00105p00029470 [Amborella trichopoda]|uniref:Rx N-terminal domain-containing protein n=1 Tax=Amborella trichopoda TaxID=13333 RepID=W1NWK1_AMBTC|nr:hypothetical protein AMTR_s00105p00029470 [Amborella trichopoda]